MKTLWNSCINVTHWLGNPYIAGFIDPDSDSDHQLYNLPRFALPDTMEDFMQYCSWIEYAKERFRKPNASLNQAE